MTVDDDDDRKVLESLRKSVAKALDHKRRLGQYAVVWKDGKVAYIGPNPPAEEADASPASSKPIRPVN